MRRYQRKRLRAVLCVSSSRFLKHEASGERRKERCGKGLESEEESGRDAQKNTPMHSAMHSIRSAGRLRSQLTSQVGGAGIGALWWAAGRCLRRSATPTSRSPLSRSRCPR